MENLVATRCGLDPRRHLKRRRTGIEMKAWGNTTTTMTLYMSVVIRAAHTCFAPKHWFRDGSAFPFIRQHHLRVEPSVKLMGCMSRHVALCGSDEECVALLDEVLSQCLHSGFPWSALVVDVAALLQRVPSHAVVMCVALCRAKGMPVPWRDVALLPLLQSAVLADLCAADDGVYLALRTAVLLIIQTCPALQPGFHCAVELCGALCARNFDATIMEYVAGRDVAAAKRCIANTRQWSIALMVLSGPTLEKFRLMDDASFWRSVCRDQDLRSSCFAVFYDLMYAMNDLKCGPWIQGVCGATGDLDTCGSCAEDFTDKDPVALLKCGHTIHVICLAAWMGSSNYPKCPYCRASLGEWGEDNSFSGSE